MTREHQCHFVTFPKRIEGENIMLAMSRFMVDK